MKELRLPPCSLQTLIFQGTSLKGTLHWCSPRYLSCRSILIVYEKKLWKQTAAYTVSHLTVISQPPRSIRKSVSFPERKGWIFTDVRNQNKSRQRWRRLTNPASIPLQPLSFLYIMQETSFLLDRGQAHICRCTNVSPGSFSIHAWDDFPLAPLLEVLKHFPLSATVPRERWGPHLHGPCCVWHRGRFESGNHRKGNPPRGN